jgi:cytoskeletal protein RodZ
VTTPEPEPPSPEQDLPWLQPTTELPAQAAQPVEAAAGRRRIIVLLLPVIGLLVLCCGGAVLTTTFFRGDTPKTGSPTLVIPSSEAPPAPSVAPPPSPTPSPTPTSKKPSTHPTTRRPKPTTAKPTTTKPKPSAPATSGGFQQNVRAGQLCTPRGAIGLTRRGQVLRCGPSVDDPRNRWRPMV